MFCFDQFLIVNFGKGCFFLLHNLPQFMDTFVFTFLGCLVLLKAHAPHKSQNCYQDQICMNYARNFVIIEIQKVFRNLFFFLSPCDRCKCFVVRR